MSDELTIHLAKTNSLQFAMWLEDYCTRKRIDNPSYPYLEGQSYNFYYPSISPGLQDHIDITATFSKYVLMSEDQSAEYYAPNWWERPKAVRVAWLEAGDRTRVRIRHEMGQWTTYPVFDLLGAIGTDWLETRSDIWRLIQEQAAKYRVELTGLPFALEGQSRAPAGNAEETERIINEIVGDVLLGEAYRAASEGKRAIPQEVLAEQVAEAPAIIDPWELSRPGKRGQDKIIWTQRQDGATWNEISSELSRNSQTLAMSTIKAHYRVMKRRAEQVGH
jgi:hypothetical protein